MFERFVSKLRPSPADPTREWPRMTINTPAVDTRRGAIGALRFGAEFAAARVFGRPDSLHWPEPGYCRLAYAAAGFCVDFEVGRLAYAAFFVAQDPSQSEPAAVAFTSPVIDGTRVTSAMSAKRIEALFGVPEEVDRDEDEWVLTYTRGATTLEFEGAGTGTLTRVNVFPTDDSQL